MNIPYIEFRDKFYKKLSSADKNILFYWSLMDTSSWEEFSTKEYYPDYKAGHVKVASILKSYRKYRESIKKDKKFVKDLIDQETLANYILGSEIEIKLSGMISVDVGNIEKRIFPDVLLNTLIKQKIHIEIKGVLSATDLRNRFNDEILPHTTNNDGCEYLVVLLLFPACDSDNMERTSRLIDGFYVYEDKISTYKESRKVFCQLISPKNETKKQNKKNLNSHQKFSLEYLVDRIIVGYFKKLELV